MATEQQHTAGVVHSEVCPDGAVVYRQPDSQVPGRVGWSIWAPTLDEVWDAIARIMGDVDATESRFTKPVQSEGGWGALGFTVERGT